MLLIEDETYPPQGAETYYRYYHTHCSSRGDLRPQQVKLCGWRRPPQPNHTTLNQKRSTDCTTDPALTTTTNLKQRTAIEPQPRSPKRTKTVLWLPAGAPKNGNHEFPAKGIKCKFGKIPGRLDSQHCIGQQKSIFELAFKL